MFNFLKSSPGSFENLEGAPFKTRYQNTPQAQLLDVRTETEFTLNTIPGAINLEVTSGQFHAALQSLDKNQEYFVFCRSGNRSTVACQILAEQGFTAYNLTGGIGAWPE